MTTPGERTATYRAHGTWGKDGRFGVRAEGEIYGATAMLESPLAVSTDLGGGPPEDGQPAGTNPEELLVAAATACLLITLGMALDRLRIPATSLAAEGVGTVARDAALGYHFAAIAVTLSLSLAGEASDDQLNKALRLAEDNCLIAKAVSGNLRYRSTLLATDPSGARREFTRES